MFVVRTICLTGLGLMILACTSPRPEEAAAAKNPGSVGCIDPRPKICHKMRHPVCATRDNGTRCVTTPCDSTDEVTYANDCLACADPAVYSYVDGACGEQAQTK